MAVDFATRRIGFTVGDDLALAAPVAIEPFAPAAFAAEFREAFNGVAILDGSALPDRVDVLDTFALVALVALVTPVGGLDPEDPEDPEGSDEEVSATGREPEPRLGSVLVK